MAWAHKCYIWRTQLTKGRCFLDILFNFIIIPENTYYLRCRDENLKFRKLKQHISSQLVEARFVPRSVWIQSLCYLPAKMHQNMSHGLLWAPFGTSGQLRYYGHGLARGAFGSPRSLWLEDDGNNEKDANTFLTLIIGAFFFLSRDWVHPNSWTNNCFLGRMSALKRWSKQNIESVFSAVLWTIYSSGSKVYGCMWCWK